RSLRAPMAAGTMLATGGWVGAVLGLAALGAFALGDLAVFLGVLGAGAAAGVLSVSVMVRVVVRQLRSSVECSRCHSTVLFICRAPITNLQGGVTAKTQLTETTRLTRVVSS